MFKFFKPLVEKFMIRQRSPNSLYMMLFEEYIANIFLNFGEIDSTILGRLAENKYAKGKAVFSGKYNISKETLKEIVNSYEKNQSIESNINSKELLRNIKEMDIEDFDKFFDKHFPEYYSDAARQWCKFDNKWIETEPVTDAIIFVIDFIMTENNNIVHIKKFNSMKCDLTIERTIIDEYAWRLDFLGKWTMGKGSRVKGILNPDLKLSESDEVVRLVTRSALYGHLGSEQKVYNEKEAERG